MADLKKVMTCLLVGLSIITGNVMAAEEIRYEKLAKEGDFALRLYAPYLIAETIVTSEFDDAGGEAFKTLFSYISGENTAQQDIAMTAPVVQEAGGKKIAMTAPVVQEKSADNWAVSFMIPANYTAENVPQPTDPKVTIREVPARYIASITYSGFWSESGYQENLKSLNEWIQKGGYNVVGEAVWARYDPPFKPWFLRRNEILIPIEAPAY